jgi:hypothetical protein
VSRVALNLAESQFALINDMTCSKSFKADEIAGLAGYSACSTYEIN